MNQVQKRVQRGAAWLDQNKPGWEHLINFEHLEMGSVCDCVLGQVFEREANIFKARSLVTNKPSGYVYVQAQKDEIRFQEYEYGFEAHPNYDGSMSDQYDDLRAEWIRVVKGRFDRGELSG